VEGAKAVSEFRDARLKVKRANKHLDTTASTPRSLITAAILKNICERSMGLMRLV
jgi:hypothetical protein